MQFQVGQFGAKKAGQFAPKKVGQVRANLVDQYHRFIHTNPGGIKEILHVSQELIYPGQNSNLQNVTNQYLDWFEHSNAPLPKENLFNNIYSD